LSLSKPATNPHIGACRYFRNAQVASSILAGGSIHCSRQETTNDDSKRQNPGNAQEYAPGTCPINCDSKRHETTGDDDSLAQNPPTSAQISPTFSDDLQRVIESWPDLPDHIKAAVLAMIESHEGRTDA
jgi:hypothetical protein